MSGKVKKKKAGKKPTKISQKLTVKQEMFCKEFLVDLNGTKAAIRAGYSPKTAHVIANENLRKPYIQKMIQKLMDKRSTRVEITADRVLKELAAIGFSNIGDYLEFGPGRLALQESEKLTREQLSCISEVSKLTSKQGTTVRFKLHGKESALELLGKHLDIFAGKDGSGQQGTQIHIYLPQKDNEKDWKTNRPGKVVPK